MREKEMTAHVASVGADTGQSPQNICIDSIAHTKEKINDFHQIYEADERNFPLSKNSRKLKTVTMEELYGKVFDATLPIIEGVLYPGTYLFAGPAKVGKSFLMAQLAYHVSTGLPLWGYSVRKGTVLYLALEDDYARLQRRLYRMFGVESTPDLHLATEAKGIDNGFEEQIKEFYEKYSDTKLIIIDVLQRVRELGGKDYSYASDYEIISKLKKLVDGTGIALLIVHHTRKQQSDDIFDMISGTNGLMGAADGAFIISKEKRTGDGAVIDLVGRDQPDQKLYLKRSPETLLWELEKAENELWVEPSDPLLDEISRLLSAESPIWQGTPTELSVLLGGEIKPNVLTMKLNINAGRLRKEYGILYKHMRGHTGRKIQLVLEEK